MPKRIVRVGYLTGARGSAAYAAAGPISDLIAKAQRDLEFSVRNTRALDEDFFNSIDLVVFASDVGKSAITVDPASRKWLKKFVSNGGIAYLGLNASQCGLKIAKDFGYVIAGFEEVTSYGEIMDPDEPIASAYECQKLFEMSDYGHFGKVGVDVPPPGGRWIATIKIALRPQPEWGYAAVEHTLGNGKAYIFSDEVPLFPDGEHVQLFKNVLHEAGARPFLK